jgi:hypothetical protein
MGQATAARIAAAAKAAAEAPGAFGGRRLAEAAAAVG